MASVLDMCSRSRLHTLTEAFLFWLPGNRENETPTSANVIKLDGCLRKRTQGGSEIKEGESTKRTCNEMRQNHLYSYKLDFNESLTFWEMKPKLTEEIDSALTLSLASQRLC